MNTNTRISVGDDGVCSTRDGRTPTIGGTGRTGRRVAARLAAHAGAWDVQTSEVR